MALFVSVMSKVLIILTGGTICMVQNKETGALSPAEMTLAKDVVPELGSSDVDVEMLSFDPLIDSSDVNPDHWSRMAQAVYDHYAGYDGFVILHGTDTMSYSGSALSFMLRNLGKPVVFTGSQLPMGVMRSDAKENLLTSIEIAAAKDEDGEALVPEVTIYFEDRLFRANRTTKRNSEHFSAFNSYNYPALAKAGVHITYQPHLIHYSNPDAPLELCAKTDAHVAILKLFPGITREVVHSVLSADGLRGVVLETYGAGNAPSVKWLSEELQTANQDELTENVQYKDATGIGLYYDFNTEYGNCSGPYYYIVLDPDGKKSNETTSQKGVSEKHAYKDEKQDGCTDNFPGFTFGSGTDVDKDEYKGGKQYK